MFKQKLKKEIYLDKNLGRVVKMLRMPHCVDNQLIDSGEVVSLTTWPRSTSHKHFSYLTEAV
jgi:hypothetical protein